ncbi:hypothetical protein CUR178_06607 [Leishmania enriettii]|uniref:Protein kinase domain-containing protein n=1 Tax=Leishmania enriettii TaxID=5663 RepID=A0A836GNK2_LEIEN|nr:hypothetical protein CUR178_06607 [Leishmania enriettii]
MPIDLLTASSAPSPPIAALTSRVSKWGAWRLKQTGQDGGGGRTTATTDSSNSSAAPTSVSVTFVVMAALTAVTASAAYHSYQALKRSSHLRRSSSAPHSFAPMRHREASGHLLTSEISMENARSAAMRSPDAERRASSAGWRRSYLPGARSPAAAHVVARANPSPTAVPDRGLDQGRPQVAGVRVKPFPLTPGTDTDADARSGNSDVPLTHFGAPPSRLAHDSTAAVDGQHITPATAAAPSTPPVTPKEHLSHHYNLEPYALQGLAGGAHGWKRVFGLLKPETHRRGGREDASAEDGEAAAAGSADQRASRSLTRTCEDSHVTTIEYPALLRESLGPTAPVTAAVTTMSPARRACNVTSDYRSEVVGSDASVHCIVPGQSMAIAEPRTTQSSGNNRQLSSVAEASSASQGTSTRPLHPSQIAVSTAAGGPSPPSRFLSSLSSHVLRYLRFCASRGGDSGPGGSSSTGAATSRKAWRSVHAAPTAETFVTSAALAMARRTLQREISMLVAATASVRPVASAPSSLSSSCAHTASCSALSSAAVSPQAAFIASGMSQRRLPSPPEAESCWSLAIPRRSSSCSCGCSEQRGKGGRADDVVRPPALVASEEDEQQQDTSNSLRHQRTVIYRQESDSAQQRSSSSTRSGMDQCGPTTESVQGQELPLPAPLTAAEGRVSPVPTEATPTEASHAAAAEWPATGFSPPSKAHRCTIAEQLMMLTNRREQQHRYTEQLQASRGWASLGAGVGNALPSPLLTSSPSTHPDTAAASKAQNFLGAELSRHASGMYGAPSAASQCYTDTTSGILFSSVLLPYRYESHVYSDVTTEVQQCKRRRQQDCATSLGACPAAVPKGGVVGEDVGHETRTAATWMATGVAATTAAAPRRSMECSAAEASLVASAQAEPARTLSASAGSSVLTSVVGNAAPLSQSKPAQPSNERRVDDLTVKHQDDGSASYSISLTYHDSETGTSRTVNTCALPPLRRCDPGTSIPGLSSLAGGPTVRAAGRPTHPTTMATLASSAAGTVSPAPSRGVSVGAIFLARAPSTLPTSSMTVATTEGSLPHLHPRRGADAEDKDTSSAISGLSRAARAGAKRLRSATRGSLTYCKSSAAAATAAGEVRGNFRGDAMTPTATSGKMSLFAAPLPPTEPQHGPRLRGVAGRNGEMAIGAFLGGGACGKVYECLNTETGQVLAAKQIVFDAKDRKLRTRLKQLELELEVLTLAARHRVRWIVGFFGAEKRGHSVLMYLEYCQRGSLLDYMMDGDRAHAAVWNACSAAESFAPQPSAAPASRSAGCSFDASGGSPVAAVEVRRRLSEHGGGTADKSPITRTGHQRQHDIPKRHTSSSAAALLYCHAQQRQHPQPQSLVDGAAAAEQAEREGEAAAAATRDAFPHVHTRWEGSIEDEDYAVHRGEPCSATASSASSSIALSASASDTFPPSEALQPQMPPLSIEQAQRFTRQVVEGLCFLHQHNYAHLDVKTANVLVAADEECRLADLGCAMRLQPPPPASLRQQQGGPSGTDVSAKGGTSAGLDDGLSPPPYPILLDRDAITELRGTALYMAPEMIRFESHAIGSPADVWSLGCVVMEMTTGCAPWRHIAKDKLRVLYRIGSARHELPLPPLICARAENAREWLVQKGLYAATSAAQEQVEERVCAMEADGVARSVSGAKKACRADNSADACDAHDSAVSDGLIERCSQRRRVDHVVRGSGVEAGAVLRTGDQGPRPLTAGDVICSGCEDTTAPCSFSASTPRTPTALRAPTTVARTNTSSSPFARVRSATTSGSLLGRTPPIGEDAASMEAEERLFHRRCRIMRLYVELQDFVAACVKVRPEDRSSAAELLRHPFLTL